MELGALCFPPRRAYVCEYVYASELGTVGRDCVGKKAMSALCGNWAQHLLDSP